ncbi:MAG: TrkH family potassium uptake protein [Evtepia sp.]
MNYKLMLRMLGRTLLAESLCLLLPLAVSLFYGEDIRPFFYTLLIVAPCGVFLTLIHSEDHFFSREGFVVVGIIWFVFGLFGALPFYFSGFFENYIDCLFEIVSGLTTTGASILKAVEPLPRGILFWRSFASWVGGMGVLLFTLAFLPTVGNRTHHLVHAETPGPMPSKLVPKTAQSSKILYGMYIVLTIIQVICLLIAGMPVFDAVTTSFATACTGGFSVRNASIGAYASPACEIIIGIFMLLFSLNFVVFFLMLTRKAKEALKSDELRFFCGVVAVAVVLVTFDILPLFASFQDALRSAFFQVATIVSTTGFSSTDFNLWPEFSKWILVLLMFIGGCAGSTAGGLKCSRVLLIGRCIRRDILQIAHPRSVKVVKLDGKVVEENILHSVSVFFACYLMITGLACLLVSLDNFSFTTTFTAVVACISNVGPGLDAVGPMGNFSAFSPFSKIGLTLCMLIGRLEIFPILILFSRTAWGR